MPNLSAYYKYRSLENFKFFMDILINNRLYAAKYTELNDIREGFYQHDGSLEKITIQEIKNIKDDIRICSLSKTSKNQPMWAHYASNHTGVVIKLKIKIIDDNIRIEPVNYGTIKTDVAYTDSFNHCSIAKEILTCKEKIWEYEEEIRVFKTVTDIDPIAFVNIEIVEIILGKRISKHDEALIRLLKEKMQLKFLIKKYKDIESS